MNQSYHLEGNCYLLIKELKEICQSLDQYIRINIMIKNQQYIIQNPKVDVQKFFQEITYDLTTQNHYLQELEKQTQAMHIQIQYRDYCELFKSRLIKLRDNHKECFEMLRNHQKIAESYFKRTLFEVQIIENFPLVLQKDYEYKNKLFLEINTLVKNDIEKGNLLLKGNHAQSLLQQFMPMAQYLSKWPMDEKICYQLLHMKVKFLVNVYKIVNGMRVTSQHNELFSFAIAWDELEFPYKQCLEYKYKQFSDPNNEYNSKIQKFSIKINKKELKKQLIRFFKNEEIKQLMKQVQSEFKLDEKLSNFFIDKIKFVANPDGKVLCETIRDYFIIINIHSIIDQLKDQIGDDDFYKIFTAFAIVLTIHGWTQMQIIRKTNQLHIEYESSLDQSDQQFLLNHLIFGTFENKSILRFIDKDIADQVMQFKTIQQLQGCLKQALDVPRQQKPYKFS